MNEAQRSQARALLAAARKVLPTNGLTKSKPEVREADKKTVAMWLENARAR